VSTSTHRNSEERASEAVVWDFGNVLVRWDPWLAVRDRYTRAEWDDFRSRAGFDALNLRSDAGLARAEGIAELEAVDPWLALVYRHYTNNFAAAVPGPVAGTSDLVRELAARGVRQFGLTNWSAEDVHLAPHLAPAIALLEGIVVSGEERIAKPDPRIFRILVERHRLDPGSALFIDDSPVNLAAASGLGFRTVLFTGADALCAILASAGLISRP